MTKTCFITLPKKKEREKCLLCSGKWGGWVVSEGQRELLKGLFSQSACGRPCQRLLFFSAYHGKVNNHSAPSEHPCNVAAIVTRGGGNHELFMRQLCKNLLFASTRYLHIRCILEDARQALHQKEDEFGTIQLAQTVGNLCLSERCLLCYRGLV